MVAHIDGKVGEAGREGGREATRVHDVCDAEPSEPFLIQSGIDGPDVQFGHDLDEDRRGVQDNG